MNMAPFGLEEEPRGAATAAVIQAGKTLLFGAGGVTSLR